MKRNQSNNLPVAEIIECTVMGQQTIMEIDGRLKFARIGDKLYTQPPQAAQPKQTVEPVAWQWLDTGTFRKTLPKTAVVSDWRQLFIHSAPARQPLTDEQDRALCEAHCNTESDMFFTARPALDSVGNRRIFYAGHRKAWINYSTLVAAIAQPKDKQRQIIAHAYQIAGACNVPSHILDVLANPNEATQDQVDAMLPYTPTIAQPKRPAPRGTDAQILKERELTSSAIVGAMAYGFQNSEYPPDDSAWLRPFWTMGRRDAEREAAIAQPEQPAPVRQPLTHTEIVRAWDASITGWIDAKQNPYTHFARAIEAAHGITTPKEAT